MAMKSEYSKIPKILYNVAFGEKALLSPWTFRALGHHLKEVGFDGVSALPLRGEDIIGQYGEHYPPIQVVENAWNPGHNDGIFRALCEGLSGEIRRLQGDASEPPLLQDTLLFPSEDTVRGLVVNMLDQHTDSWLVASHFQSLFPPCPGRQAVHAQSDFKQHTMSVIEVLEWAQDWGVKLWYDPNRLIAPRSVSLPGEPIRTHKDTALTEIRHLGEQLVGIDIGSRDPQDIKDLLCGRGFLIDVAYAAREFGVPFQRVEITTPLHNLLPKGLRPSPLLRDVVSNLRGIAL